MAERLWRKEMGVGGMMLTQVDGDPPGIRVCTENQAFSRIVIWCAETLFSPRPVQ